ncbi:AAA family ATPase [Bacillus alkalicellulosilyticus]|uniref:AAA family ATPase n=1 Tax=Alkalihalobacterium alkalicellulosilyticum TaxID=1912214 RepID=UPI0009963BF6|nr:AAA family ATPase [Bacillus alkalicellulosilyticus]
MKDDRISFLNESFQDISEDMNKALHEKDLDTVDYIFLRTYRLLDRTEEFLVEQVRRQNSWRDTERILAIKASIQMSMSKWNAELAEYYKQDGDKNTAEREWLAALAQPTKDADFFVQYAHVTVENKHLFVHKDIKDNIEFVNRYNIYEVKKCLRRARFSLKAAVSMSGMTDAIGYFIGWIDLLEQEIAERPELVEALSCEEENITIEAALAQLNTLIGLDSVKQRIHEISNWVTFSQLRREGGFKVNDLSLHMVFSGNPGTGKTTVARIVASIYKALGVLKKGHLVEARRADLVAEYVGQTATKTMKVIKEAEGGVLFIDEAYALTRFSGGNDFGIEAIDTIVKEMEDNRSNLVVILAGYPKEMKDFIAANPGLQSRFKFHIDFPDYSLNELTEIMDLLLKDKQYRMKPEAKQIASKLIEKQVIENPTTHGNGRLVRNLLEDAILTKAAQVVDNKVNSRELGELDLIDEEVMRLVKFNGKSKEERNHFLKDGFQ